MRTTLCKAMLAGSLLALSLGSATSGHAAESTKTYSTARYSIDLPVSWHSNTSVSTKNLGPAESKVASSIFLTTNSTGTAIVGILVSGGFMSKAQASSAEHAMLLEGTTQVKVSAATKQINGVTFIGESGLVHQNGATIKEAIYFTLYRQRVVYLLAAAKDNSAAQAISPVLNSFRLH